MEGDIEPLVELRSSIQKAFPTEPFSGQVTPVDEEPDEELDDERMLYRELSHKSWINVPKDFIREHAGDLVLLTPKAFASFLPAWLLAALDGINDENLIRDQVVFTFTPKPDLVPDMTIAIKNQILSLRPEQLEALRTFLSLCSISDPSAFIRKQAESAAAFINSILASNYG